MRYIFSVFFVLCFLQGYSQAKLYTTYNAHAHNDYENDHPFWGAYKSGFGSIEADVFLHNGQLVVAHDSAQLSRLWTLDSLYLRPLQQCLQANGGTIYPDSTKSLQLMVDIKSEAEPTLQALMQAMKAYPALQKAKTLTFVISGNRPLPSAFASYPSWIQFDGEMQKTYKPEEWKRIEMVSGNFKKITSWNGKGRMVEKERAAMKKLVESAHAKGKKFRFWNTPDNLNAWYTFVDEGIDYINTDRIPDIRAFFDALPHRQFTNPAPHIPYVPTYRNNGAARQPKNIILLIGDGTGLAQWYAGYTANKGALNVFNMRHTGLSKTSSFDNFITDSAPGATAFSAGEKTNNRAVGVDHTGKKLRLLPEILAARKMKTGVITSGDLRDATPAAFYAHTTERSRVDVILNDFAKSSVDLLIGALPAKLTDSLQKASTPYTVLSAIGDFSSEIKKPVLVADTKASLPATGRGRWASEAFQKAITALAKNKEGFLLVVEGAQIDHGGHANRLPYLVSELLDFDNVIGEAMAFADTNGETLVVVTGDHETGGLTLTGGDYSSGQVRGEFSTDDHTAIPVPVFAYGPGAQLFDGVYENTAVFQKILQALKPNTQKKQ